MVKQNIMVNSECTMEEAHFIEARKQNEREEGTTVIISPSVAHIQLPNFFSLGPTS
jgi:hypothetical protein